jgi:hypothetical protein
MSSPRRSWTVPVGCLLIGLAVLLSGPLLEWAILPTGTIVGTARRAPALAACRVFLAIAGAALLLRRPRITAVHLAALALCGLLAGIFGSGVLQAAYVPAPIASGWKAFAPKREQNDLGYRGRRIASDSVVLLLGDSQVEAMAVPFDAMPERRLESYLASSGLKTRVFSLGAGGYGQDQELLALEEYYRKYRADLVLLWETPANDVWNNVFNTHMANRNPKPTYWLDASGRLKGPTESLCQPLGDSRIVIAGLWQRTFGLAWRDKAWERSLPAPYVPMIHYEGVINHEWQERWNTNLGRMRDEELDTEKSHLAVGLTPRRARMQYGLDLTRASIGRIQDLVQANHGTLVVFQTQTSEALPKGDQVYVLNDNYYRVSSDQFCANWNSVNQGFETEVIPVTVTDWRVGPTDAHLKRPGHRPGDGGACRTTPGEART